MTKADDLLFAVQRNGIPSSCKGDELKDKLKEDDLLMVTRSGVTYNVKVTADPDPDPTPDPLPWDNEDIVWHVTNKSVGLKGYEVSLGIRGPYKSWRKIKDDWQDNGEISSIPKGAEVVFVGNVDSSGLFSFNFDPDPTDGPDFEFGEYTKTDKVTSMEGLVNTSPKFTGIGVEYIDTSSVTNMQSMFGNCPVFNGDVSGYDTSNVTNMAYTFFGDKGAIFNQDLSGWDTSKVTIMFAMFKGQKQITENGISGFDVSKVTNMDLMFYSCNNPSLSLDLSNWDVSNVTLMNNMFQNATHFTSDLSKWDVSNVTEMLSLFKSCKAFNSDLSEWCVPTLSYSSWFDEGCDAWVLPRPCFGSCGCP
jgi:surface protein